MLKAALGPNTTTSPFLSFSKLSLHQIHHSPTCRSFLSFFFFYLFFKVVWTPFVNIGHDCEGSVTGCTWLFLQNQSVPALGSSSVRAVTGVFLFCMLRASFTLSIIKHYLLGGFLRATFDILLISVRLVSIYNLASFQQLPRDFSDLRNVYMHVTEFASWSSHSSVIFFKLSNNSVWVSGSFQHCFLHAQQLQI